MEEEPILISVIVPIYKVEVFLRQCIESIINQTYKRLEIILVDDGSPDLCPQICDEYMKMDSRITVIHKKNEGLVSARKAGVETATGEYITFVDGDDWIEYTLYNDLIKKLDRRMPDILCYGLIQDLPNDKKIIRNKISNGYYSREAIEEKIIPQLVIYKNSFNFGIESSLCNKLIKKDLIKTKIQRESNEITIGEDLICTFQCIVSANAVQVVNEITGYIYQCNVQSMTKQYDNNILAKLLVLFYQIDDICKDMPSALGKQFLIYKLYMMLGYGMANEAIDKNINYPFRLYRYFKRMIINNYLFRLLQTDELQNSLFGLKKRKIGMNLRNNKILSAVAIGMVPNCIFEVLDGKI